MKRARRRAAAVAWALLSAAALAHGAGEVVPGAYCPLPQKGEVPACLEPARDPYGGFFAGLETGEPGDAAVARLEADVERGGASERPYLALSTLAYGYYRLAQVAASTPGEDPTIVSRLERWNALLARAYAGAEDPSYRSAVRTAALDVSNRSPAVALRCRDARGEVVQCSSTEAVLRGLDQASGEVGVRGALRRILERLTGRDGS